MTTNTITTNTPADQELFTVTPYRITTIGTGFQAEWTSGSWADAMTRTDAVQFADDLAAGLGGRGVVFDEEAFTRVEQARYAETKTVVILIGSHDPDDVAEDGEPFDVPLTAITWHHGHQTPTP